MPKHGKKFQKVFEAIDGLKMYDVAEAVELVLKSSYAKFDETVDIAVNLGVNPKYSDQMVRGAVSMPHGLGKTVRVVAFCKGENEEKALSAGAIAAGGDELVEKIKGGWLDFDNAVATPDMMGHVGKIGKILGPRGLMPNAKTGTVTVDWRRPFRNCLQARSNFVSTRLACPCAHRQGFLWPREAARQPAYGCRCTDQAQTLHRQGYVCEGSVPVLHHGTGRQG
jgi:large subunit ribosomal protein L1